jgi:vancomycin resistance protein VanJ
VTPHTGDVDRRRPLLRLVAWPYAVASLVLLALWLARLDLPVTQLLDLATFWWTLPSLALLLVALVGRDGRAALLFAVPAITWLWSFGGAFVPGGGADVAADLRVVSYNTYVAAPDGSHVVEVAEMTGADVLLLQEVFADREAQLTEAFADRYPHAHVDRSEGVGAVVVFSRHPITDVATIGDASGRSRSTSVITVDVAGRPVQLASVHLISPCPTCGTSVLERLELETQVRAAEVGAVLETLDPDLPAVIGGDLNSNDRSTAYRRLVDAGFADAQRDAGSGMGFTWPADGSLPPLVRIDWVLTRGMRTQDAFVAEARASDHRPVVVDVAFPDDGET